MRSTNVILLVVLLALGFTSSFDFASFVELGDLKNDPYGKSLIETIQMSMEKSPGGKIENIQALLVELLRKLHTEQENANAEWGKLNKKLTTHISNLHSEINHLRVEVRRLRRLRSNFVRRRNRAERNIKQYRLQRTQDIATLNALIVRRRRDRVYYENSQKEHSALIGAIRQVLASLNKLRGSIAGVKRPSHVASISAETRDMRRSLAEIVGDDEEAQAFIELATEADQSALSRLIALLNNINRHAQKSMDDDRANERHSRATFKRLRLGLKNDIATLNNALKKQRERLSIYKRRINELSNKIKIRRSILVTKRKELVQVETARRNAENQYNVERKQRRSEMRVIRRVQRIVNERLARMSQFLRGQVNK